METHLSIPRNDIFGGRDGVFQYGKRDTLIQKQTSEEQFCGT